MLEKENFIRRLQNSKKMEVCANSLKPTMKGGGVAA